MKILHTADVHLHSSHPQRLEALVQVLELGKSHSVDLLIIAGDLFDSDQEADKLRPRLRSLFRDLPYEILAIPGNHDQNAYNRDQFFGECFRPQAKAPFTVLDYDDTRLVFLPYFNGSMLPLAAELREQKAQDRRNILVLHCTWALPHHINQDFGNQDEERYLPVTPDLLDSLGYDLLLAGHFHSGYRRQSLAQGGIFIYSGSPSPITTREQGRRYVNLVTDNQCQSLELAVPYLETISLTARPGQEEALLARLTQELALHPPQLCRPTVQIGGFTAWDEGELYQALKNCSQELDLDFTCRGVRAILEDPLYLRLAAKLKGDILHGDVVEGMLLEAFCLQGGKS